MRKGRVQVGSEGLSLGFLHLSSAALTEHPAHHPQLLLSTDTQPMRTVLRICELSSRVLFQIPADV
eukprot:3311519-Rhodomonas_salina.1